MSLKGSLIIYLSFQNGLNFSPKILDKKDKRRVKKYPNLLNQTAFRDSRVIKSKFKKRFKICISHKTNLTAVAFCKGKFGIDVEEIRKRNFKAVSEFCFAKDEMIAYKSDQSIEKFYQIYTIKEALIKARNLKFSELALVSSVGSSDYVKRSFIINDKFILSAVFKCKKDIIIKIL